MAAAKFAKIEETDMISALPDELLVTILLLLPIKDAVATMILSKRWRFVWTMLPSLEYEGNGDRHDDRSCYDYVSDKGDDDDKSKKSTNWLFFDKSMELHKAPVLRNLVIKLGPECPSDADVGKWLIKAVERRVVVLKFKLCWSTGPIRLPKSLYSCETLKELTLSHKILVDFPPSSSCLPSLLNLNLFYVVYKDDASLVRFLSSCPLLEALNVRRNWKHDNVTKFSVKVPSLKYFIYIDLFHRKEDTDGYSGRCLVFDTPALTHIKFIDFSRVPWSMENMPCLEIAYIDVRSFPDIDKSSKTYFSRVWSLELLPTDKVFTRCSTLNFSRLIELSVFPTDVSNWLEPLLCLLENAPKLKDLLISQEYPLFYTESRIPLSWSQPKSVPGCISSHLEIFVFRARDYSDIEEEVEKFLTYILANSKCLKTATIKLRPDFPLEKEESIIKRLEDIPRVSMTSQLLFQC